MSALPLQPPGAPPAVFLVNANSRRGAEDLDTAIAALRDSGLNIVPRSSESEADSEEVLREEIAASAPFVIVGGGDGTLSSCAGILAETNTALAALPMGTGNTLARSLGLPMDLAEAAKALASGRITRMDVGRVNDRIFVNSVTLGLSAGIARELDGDTKKRLGLLAWPVVGARVLFGTDALRLRLTSEEQTVVLRTRQLVVANGRYVAGPMAAAPDATIDDGLLDVFALGGAGFGSLLVGALLWLTGRHREAPAAQYQQTRAITVESLRHPVEADVDGEMHGTTPLKIEIMPAALAVVAPRDFATKA